MAKCEFCPEANAVETSIAQNDEHKRSVHPMEYTIASKQRADPPVVLNEAEKQFVEEQAAKKPKPAVRAYPARS